MALPATLVDNSTTWIEKKQFVPEKSNLNDEGALLHAHRLIRLSPSDHEGTLARLLEHLH